MNFILDWLEMSRDKNCGGVMVTVMLCFARSGGTVLNRCLGCLPDIVIMSEVNPLGG